jgi:adenosylmethionine-8-amino-7-oxononanoate aminotransferase
MISLSTLLVFTPENITFLSLRNGYHGLVGSAGSVTNMPAWSNNVLRGNAHEKLAWPSKYKGIHQTV